MKTRMVKRYWCDHCNKAGLQERAMAKHEQHCTMNPDRSCRVCALLERISGDERGAPLADLLALLPDYVPYTMHDSMGNAPKDYVEFCADLDISAPILRNAAKNCPACMMAALRQKKIPVHMIDGFDFSAEMRAIFNDMNEFHADQQGYY